MHDVLIRIGKALNNNNIIWGVGASVMLSQYGIVVDPRDIDILVAVDDIYETDRIFQGLGIKRNRDDNIVYSTEYFYEYIVNEVDVDVMAGLTVNHSEGVYNHLFNEDSITMHKLADGIEIPYSSLEEWYVIYQLLPGREDKVELIEDYFAKHGIGHPNLLRRFLKGQLPRDVIERTKKILKFR